MDMKSRSNYLIFAIVALFITPVVLWVNNSNRYPQKTLHPYPDMTIVLEKDNGHWQVISHEYPNFMDKRAKKYIEAFPLDDQVPSTYSKRVFEYEHNRMYDEAIATQAKMISLIKRAQNKADFEQALIDEKKHLEELKLLKRLAAKTNLP